MRYAARASLGERVDSEGRLMALADDIVSLIERKHWLRGRLREVDIADMLYGQNNDAYQQQVNAECRRLVENNRLLRLGQGGPSDPYTYDLPLVVRKLWS